MWLAWWTRQGSNLGLGDYESPALPTKLHVHILYLQSLLGVWHTANVDRTVRICLQPSKGQTEALHETVKQFTQAFNTVCRTGWEQRTGNAYTLQRLVYRSSKDVLPDLVSDLHIQAIRKASETLRSAISRQKKGLKTGCPESPACPPRYNLHTFKVYWDTGIISLSTSHGRMKVPFNLPEYARYAQGSPTATADLIYRKGRFYLHVVVQLPDVPFVDNGQAIGVDLGVDDVTEHGLAQADLPSLVNLLR